MTRLRANIPLPNESLVGTTVARKYRIESILGRGGSSVVYLAREALTGCRRALKILAPEDRGIDRFMNEVCAVLAVESPHVVNALDFGRLEDGSGYLVMEYLDGRTLSDVLRAERFVDVRRTLHIAKQIARAAIAAHEACVVHRDLKPENVLLTRRGDDPDFVRILDFGLAEIKKTGVRASSGVISGTPLYMSPEQAEGGEVGPRADVYSLGVVLYEMLAGRAPFSSNTTVGFLTQHLCVQPRPMTTLAGLPQTVPAELDSIVLKCLAKKPSERHASMNELLTRLEGMALEEESAVMPAPRTAARPGTRQPSGTHLRGAVGRFLSEIPPFLRKVR